MALRFLLRFPAFPPKEQNGPFFTFSWLFQTFLAVLHPAHDDATLDLCVLCVCVRHSTPLPAALAFLRHPNNTKNLMQLANPHLAFQPHSGGWAHRAKTHDASAARSIARRNAPAPLRPAAVARCGE